jgi:8-oxo-dGTP diphosphatase
MASSLPYKIAVLCYLYDNDGHLLLLHRDQEPNIGRYSPVGGKVDIASGEGPHQCAVREVAEETGVTLDPPDLRLTGIVSERAYQEQAHWLIFLFEMTAPLDRDRVKWTRFNEGTLEWVRLQDVAGLPLPRTDRDVMWPLVQEHRGGFFVVHIDWSADDLRWTVHESVKGREANSE